MTRWTARLGALADHRFGRYGLALLCGLALALAHPPFGFWPGLLGLGGVVALLDRLPKQRLWPSFWVGFAAGYGYFQGSCFWVAEAVVLFDPDLKWLSLIIIPTFPILLAPFWGAAAAAYQKLRPDGLWKFLTFAGIFAIFEWMRGWLFTGFPWNPLGAVFPAGSAPSQIAAYVNIWGLTAITAAVAASTSVLFAGGALMPRLRVLGAAAVVLAGLYGLGAARLSAAHPAPTGLTVRLVQPNVGQDMKWSEASAHEVVERYLRLTSAKGPGPRPDVILWPEGSLPWRMDDLFAPDSWVRAAIRDALQPGQILLMGGYRQDVAPSGAVRDYNTLIAVRRTQTDLSVQAIYDKHRLVPFGEFLPFDAVFRVLGIKALVHFGDGDTPGPRPSPRDLPGLPRMQPLICYESLFPQIWSDAGGRGEWFAVVSNDAWYGKVSGPEQHLNLGAYRAIETGRPMMQATPTGVTAAVDPWGRISPGRRLGPGQEGFVDSPLLRPLNRTLSERTGDIPFWLIVFALLGNCVFLNLSKKK